MKILVITAIIIFSAYYYINLSKTFCYEEKVSGYDMYIVTCPTE